MAFGTGSFNLSINPGTVVSTSRSEYDTRGRMVASFDTFGSRTEYTYDTLGRTVEPRSQGTDELGNLVWLVSRSVYDELGRVVASMDRYVEDPVTGQPTQLTQGNRGVYDEQGQPVEIICADGSTMQTVYDFAPPPHRRYR